MSQFDDSGYKTYVASEAIPKYARVTLASTGLIEDAGITAKEIGTALEEAFASGDRVTVKLRTAPGTHKMIAAAAVTLGATVFTAASGKVSVSASTAFQVGQVVGIDGTVADGNVIEVLYNAHGDTAV
jgi:hypothetical protein